MLASLGMNFFVAPYMPTFVVITQQRFKGTPAMLALMDAGFFLGMLAGSLSLLRIPVRRVGWAFSGFLMLAGMAVLPMGYVPNPWLFGLLNFVCGIFIPPASVPLSTLIQSETPDGMRGRVNAALGMISALVVPVGVALSGLLLRLLGIEGTFLFMGFGLIFCPLLALLARDFRHARLPANNTGNADREPI
jgi:MFS family permease